SLNTLLPPLLRASSYTHYPPPPEPEYSPAFSRPSPYTHYPPPPEPEYSPAFSAQSQLAFSKSTFFHLLLSTVTRGSPLLRESVMPTEPLSHSESQR
ncbi:hypothetical protein KUCAC02_034564, partial [Chaenocephalus aceratus]